jgi:4-hydroxy-tetrahydrodipicolinate synthase
VKLTTNFGGVIPIVPTPFYDDGRIDETSLDRLVGFFEGCGVDSLTLMGQLGEASKLEPREAMSIVSRVIKRTSLPIVVGVSSPSFAVMKVMAREAMDLGACGVMIAPINTLRTDDQIVGYYRDAVEAIGNDIPFILQDYPLTFSVVMTPDVIRRIVSEQASCMVVKHEDWPGLEKISALRRFQQEGTLREVAIVTGNGGLFLDFEMERGADGANTGYAFPEMLVDVVRFSKAGERDAAHDLFDAHLPFLRYEHQMGALGLAVRKYVFKRRGLLASDAQRKPGMKLTAQAQAEVDYLLSRVARFDRRAKLG